MNRVASVAACAMLLEHRVCAIADFDRRRSSGTGRCSSCRREGHAADREWPSMGARTRRGRAFSDVVSGWPDAIASKPASREMLSTSVDADGAADRTGADLIGAEACDRAGDDRQAGRRRDRPGLPEMGHERIQGESAPTATCAWPSIGIRSTLVAQPERRPRVVRRRGAASRPAAVR